MRHKCPLTFFLTRTLAKLLEVVMQNYGERLFSLIVLPSRNIFVQNSCFCNLLGGNCLFFFISARSGELGAEEGMACMLISRPSQVAPESNFN